MSLKWTATVYAHISKSIPLIPHQFHKFHQLHFYAAGFKAGLKEVLILTETEVTSMSLFKIFIQCKNHIGLETIKNPDESNFNVHFKQIVESGLYKWCGFLKVRLTTHSNTLTLLFKRIKKLYLPLCSKGAKTTTKEPEPAAERESEEQ